MNPETCLHLSVEHEPETMGGPVTCLACGKHFPDSAASSREQTQRVNKIQETMEYQADPQDLQDYLT